MEKAFIFITANISTIQLNRPESLAQYGVEAYNYSFGLALTYTMLETSSFSDFDTCVATDLHREIMRLTEKALLIRNQIREAIQGDQSQAKGVLTQFVQEKGRLEEKYPFVHELQFSFQNVALYWIIFGNTIPDKVKCTQFDFPVDDTIEQFAIRLALPELFLA
jgi:hypothetical protein